MWSWLRRNPSGNWVIIFYLKVKKKHYKSTYNISINFLVVPSSTLCLFSSCVTVCTNWLFHLKQNSFYEQQVTNASECTTVCVWKGRYQKIEKTLNNTFPPKSNNNANQHAKRNWQQKESKVMSIADTCHQHP